jgi:hypothetical protein
VPRRHIKIWAYLLPPPTEPFLRSPEGQLLVNLLTDWWIRREELFEVGPRVGQKRYPDVRYGQVAFYQMLAARHFPALTDRQELALDAVHSAFQRWTRTPKARRLAERSSRQIRSELARRLADERPGLDLDDLGDRLIQALGSQLHQEVAHLVGQDVHQAIHHDVHHAVHQSVHSAVQDAALHHAGGGHTDGGHH